MLPETSESTERPRNVPMRVNSPRPGAPISITPATSSPNRTQRVQWMQRVISVEIRGPMSGFGTTRLVSW